MTQAPGPAARGGAWALLGLWLLLFYPAFIAVVAEPFGRGGALALAVLAALVAALSGPSRWLRRGLRFGGWVAAPRLPVGRQLLGRLDELGSLGHPLLVGASRKRFLSPWGAEPAERDEATAIVLIQRIKGRLGDKAGARKIWEAALAKEPALAAAPMRAIRGSAREALVDMRQLLHVLRAEAPADAGNLTPARGIADLTQLVGTMREAGLPIEADIRAGESLSSGVQLAVYRIAQEGLTNVRKHAGAVPTRLLVVRDGDTLRIEVRNAPSTRAGATGMPSTGHGLIGLRERVHAAGGTLDAGATPEGGFELVARLPLDPSERIR